MPRELRNEVHANVVMTASRIGPLRRMAPAPVKPRKPVVRPLFIPEHTPMLPQSRLGWFICGAIFLFGDVAPIAFIAWQLWGRT